MLNYSSSRMKTGIFCRSQKHAEERKHLNTFYLALKVLIHKMDPILLQGSWQFQAIKLVKLYCKAEKPQNQKKPPSFFIWGMHIHECLEAGHSALSGLWEMARRSIIQKELRFSLTWAVQTVFLVTSPNPFE